MATVEERVRQILQKRCGVEPDELTDGALLAEDLGADSLGAVQIVLDLEKEFKIEIPDEDAEKIKTVRQVIDYVQKQAK